MQHCCVRTVVHKGVQSRNCNDWCCHGLGPVCMVYYHDKFCVLSLAVTLLLH